MEHTIIALFKDRVQARGAQTALLDAGFPSAAIVRSAAAPPTRYLLALIASGTAQIARAAAIVERHDPVTIDAGERGRLLAGDYFTERR